MDHGRLRDLRGRLDARRGELEQAALARITAIADPAEVSDPSYVVGLRAALAAALDYGLGTAEEGGQAPPPIPLAILAQARAAARAGVSLETVLRRYASGHGLLSDSLLDEAAAAGVGMAELKGALRVLAARYDRLIAAVSEEYGRETKTQPLSTERRRYALVRGLLAGEPLDTSELDYRLEGHHLAIVATGATATAALERLGRRVDRRLLLVASGGQAAWAWLGGRRPIAAEECDLIASHPWPQGCAVACGESSEGVTGWRLSHRQAAAALPIARRGRHPLVRYADVALLASALQDDLLMESLRLIYLEPLQSKRDGGATALATLRAYFGAERNAASTAAVLGVSPQAISRRLRNIETSLGRPLGSCVAPLELALSIRDFEETSAPPASVPR